MTFATGGYGVNWKAMIQLLCVPALLAAGAAQAQTASGQCPALPTDAQQTLRWEAMQAGDMLFCRAITTDTGAEAFAVTISRSSPFKPRRPDRAEKGTFNGAEVQWYRGEDAANPKILIRETLLELSDGGVAHIFIRTESEQDLARYQQVALLARF